jgi:Fic family protein
MSIKSKNIFNKIKRNSPYFEDFITRSIYHSNAIEGNTLSYEETYAIVFNCQDVKITSSPREIYEAINLKYAFNYVLQNLDSSLTIKYIKDLGILINKNISDISGFRTTQVFIRGTQYIPPDAIYVNQLISQLVYKDGKQRSEDMFEYLARFHITFERIHPFVDGNGRTGRLLLCKELLSRGYTPLVIPLDYRMQYLQYIANQDIDNLAVMLKSLNKFEIDRMSKFGIKL